LPCVDEPLTHCGERLSAVLGLFRYPSPLADDLGLALGRQAVEEEYALVVAVIFQLGKGQCDLGLVPAGTIAEPKRPGFTIYIMGWSTNAPTEKASPSHSAHPFSVVRSRGLCAKRRCLKMNKGGGPSVYRSLR
jgi:hypothetical protein